MTASTLFLFFDMWLAFSNLYFEKYKFWTYFFTNSLALANRCNFMPHTETNAF